MKRLSLSEASKVLGVSVKTIRNLISDGTFPHPVERYGSRVLIVLDDNPTPSLNDSDIQAIADRLADALLKKTIAVAVGR